MIISDRWKDSTSQVIYVPTEKEPPLGASEREQAYWMLSMRIEDALGPEGGTLDEIYHQVMVPLGLSLSDTTHLVKSARAAGYLK